MGRADLIFHLLQLSEHAEVAFAPVSPNHTVAYHISSSASISTPRRKPLNLR